VLAYDLCWVAGISLPRRERRYDSWLYAAVSILFLGYPGGFITRVLTGQPPPLFSDQTTILSSLLVWALVVFTPLGLLAARLRYVLAVGGALSSLRSITRSVDLFADKFPTSPVTAIFLGAVAGSMGGLCDRLERKYVAGDAAIKLSSHALQRSLLVSAIYFSQTQSALPAAALLRPFAVLDAASTQVLVGALIVVPTALLWEYGGASFSVFAPWESVLRRVVLRPSQLSFPSATASLPPPPAAPTKAPEIKPEEAAVTGETKDKKKKKKTT
jgi:hypothetical protein